MAVQDPPLFLQSDAHPAKYFRQMLAALTGVPLGTFTSTSTVASGGGGHGIVGATDLLVVENGTPNMSVNVGSGRAFVHGTEGSDQAVYLVTNDATANVAISTANGSNPRKDIVCIQVRDAGGGYSGSSNDARLVVVAGTAAASPVDPALPVNCVPLARVDVPANDTAITNSQITDLRRRAWALGGTGICTSTTRPTGVILFEGLEMYETDQNRYISYDGTGWLARDTDWVIYTPSVTNFSVGNGSLAAFAKREWRDIWVKFAYILGSSSTMANNAQVGLPTTHANDLSEGGANTILGRGTILDSAVANYDAVVFLQTSAGLDRVILGTINVSGTYAGLANVTNTVPMTWGVADSFIIEPFLMKMSSPYV